MLKYRIKIRPPSKEESPRECLLEEVNSDNFEIRLNAMMADIRNIPGIISLIRIEYEIIISTNFDVATIKEKLKHLFSRDYCHIRFIELEEVSV
jgi:hypothetical protein